MANLSVEDLFFLFNQACQAQGATGYAGKLANQTAKTVATWTEFHKELMLYIIGNPTIIPKLSPTVTKVDALRATEDAISADVKKYEWDGQVIMYRLLYNLGHRINR